MPRGNKLCEFCGTANGPRSRNCKSCLKGFVVKGIRQPDITQDENQQRVVKAHRSKQAQNKRNQQLKELVVAYNGKDDKKKREKYNVKGRTWQSKCGRYRICERLTFMGVNMKGAFGKPFYVYERSNDDWEPIKPRHRFRSLKRALMKLYELKNGKRFSKNKTKQEEIDEMRMIKNGSHKTHKESINELNRILNS